jgi:hypothetical protein
MQDKNSDSPYRFNRLSASARTALVMGLSTAAFAGCGGETNRSSGKASSTATEITATPAVAPESASRTEPEMDTYEEIYDKWAACLVEVNSNKNARLGDSDKCSDDRDQALQELENQPVSQP